MNKKAIFLLTAVVLFTVFGAEAQCSQCKLISEAASVANDEALLGVEKGSTINDGIIYIMIVPYIILFILFRKRIVKFFKEFKRLGASKA